MKKRLMMWWILLLPVANVFAQDSYIIHSSDHISVQINEYGHGKPVILLAGGPGFNAMYLEPIWKSLPNYRFIVPDQRGTGHSFMNTIDSGKVGVQNFVDDLEILRKHLKLNKLTIAGHSWGGMLALAYAARYPGHVDRLILLGSGGVTEKFFTYFSSNIRMRMREEDMAEAKAAKNLASNLKAIWPGYFYNRESAIATKGLVDTNLADHNASKINHFALNDYKKTGHLRIAGLRQFKGAVYVIQGRQDPVGESTVYETKEIMPQTKVYFIEKCGHLPWLENEATAAKFFELIDTALY